VDESKVQNMGEAPDNRQVGIEWIPIEKVDEFDLYPTIIRDAISQGELQSLPNYLGDVN
jgi:hypothetical protein